VTVMSKKVVSFSGENK